jgi:hypothetical protein
VTDFDTGHLFPMPFPELHDFSGSSLSIQERFERFHQANPWVYESLRTLSLDLVGRGQTRIGIGMLFEVMRWHYARSTKDPSSDFRLNNDYRSRYSRLLMDNEPELAFVFETRVLRAV